MSVSIPFNKSSKPRNGFDTAAFIDSVAADLDSAARGYAAVLQGKAGAIIAKATYGYARTPSEKRGVQPFNLNTQTAWGSVTKMITAAAVIDKTERSDTRNLDEKMVDFLPERWRDQVHTDLRNVKIRELLSYKGGHWQTPPGANKSDLLARLKGSPTLVGSRAYNNENFAVILYMGRFFRQGHWDKLEEGFTSGEIQYNDFVFVHGLSIYKQVIRDRIFKPLGIDGRCNEVDYSGNNYALFYANSQSEEGYFLNPADKRGCSTGGIVTSARHMSKFLHALTRTDEVISRGNYNALLAVSNNDLVGWNGSVAVEGGMAFQKAGARNLSGDSIPGNTAFGKCVAHIMAYPNGMSAVVCANSGLADGTKGLKHILADAYNAGLS